MVSPEYVMYLLEIANEKMKQNRERTDAFYQALTCEVNKRILLTSQIEQYE